MSEAEWLASVDIQQMSQWLAAPGRTSPRKLRLFAVACCRRIPLSLLPPVVAEALNFAEAFADGEAPDLSRREVEVQVEDVRKKVDPFNFAWDRDPTYAENMVHYAVCSVGWALAEHPDAFHASHFAATALGYQVALSQSGTYSLLPNGNDPVLIRRRNEEVACHSNFARDVVGNLFRPVKVQPTWFTSTAIGLAQTIYEEKAFDRLPILADALQDAGCENADILAHCRGDGPHVRGCWVVDLVLRKE